MKIRTKTTFRALVMSTIFLLASVMAIGQKTAATGNWNTATTWTPNGVPTATDNVIIPTAVTVTVNIAGATCANATVNGTGKLNVPVNTSLIVTGTLNVLSSASTGMTLGGYIHVLGNYTSSNNSGFAQVGPQPGNTDGVPQLLVNGYISSGTNAGGLVLGSANDTRTSGVGSTYNSGRSLRAGVSNLFAYVVTMTNYPTFTMTDCFFPPMTLNVKGYLSGASPAGLAVVKWQESSTNIGSGYTDIVSTSFTYAPTATTTTKWYRAVYTVGALPGVYMYSYPVELVGNPANTRTWDGSTSTVWTDASNWAENIVPDLFSNVTIPASMPNYPSLPLADVDVKSLTIDAGATVTQHASGDLELHCGNLVNNGTLVQGFSNSFYGATQSVSGSTPITFNTIRANYTALTFESDAVLVKNLLLGASVTFDPDGAGNSKVFLLKSTADNPDATAQINSIPVGSSITGKVRYQRYMDAYEAPFGSAGEIPSLISIPVSGATVSDFQGEVLVSGDFTGANDVGYGTWHNLVTYDESVITDIDGSGVFNQSDGFFDFPLNTNTETFSSNQGYHYWRLGSAFGDNDVTWSVDGIPTQGNVTVPVTFTSSNTEEWKDGWVMIPNPYASTVDWMSGGILNIETHQGTIYWYDWVDNGLTHAFNYTLGLGIEGGTQYQASGQSVWIKSDYGGIYPPASNTNSSITFTEAAKTTWTGSGIAFTSTKNSPFVPAPPPSGGTTHIRLNLNSAGNSSDVILAFFEGGTADLDRKLDFEGYGNASSDFQIVTKKGSHDYLINTLSIDSIRNSKVDLKAFTVVSASSSLTWTLNNMPSNNRIRLYDKELSVYTDMKANSTYAYTSTANNANGRFQIILDVTPAASAPSAPAILASSKGTSATAATTHTATYPTGTTAGDLLMFIAVGKGQTPTVPSDPSSVGKTWRGFSQTSGGINTRVAFKYALGEEFDVNKANGSFTFTTAASVKVSWMVLRLPSNTAPVFGNQVTGAASASVTAMDIFRAGSGAGSYRLLDVVMSLSDALPSAASTGFTVVNSQAGASTDGVSVWAQSKTLASTANTSENRASVTMSKSTDYVNRSFAFVALPTSTNGEVRIPFSVFDFGSTSGYNGLNSTTPVKAIAQSFKGNGELLKRIGVQLKKSATVTGTMVMKIYAHSGTFGTSSIPTGTALATSTNSVSVANLGTTAWQRESFEFTALRLDVNKSYVFALEVSDISGGNVQVEQSASTTPMGNASQSGNLTSWTNTSVSDLVYFPETVIGSSEYIWSTDFSNISVTGNVTLTDAAGIQSGNSLFLDAYLFDCGATDTTKYVQKVEYDASVGKNVMRFQAKDDNTGTSCLDAPFLDFQPYATAGAFDTLHYQMEMKFHADIQYLEQYSSATNYGITQILSEKKLSFDGDNSSKDFTMELSKNSGVGQPLQWKLYSQYRQPNAKAWTSVWENGIQYNSTVAVPYGQWFTMDVSIIKGSGNGGRMIVKIKVGAGAWQTLFDVYDYMEYPSQPELNLISISPMKLYASDALLDFMRTANKKFEHRYSSIKFFKK